MRRAANALVVVCLVALILGLVLGAVARVRRAAASSSCVNNLRQVGLGLENYHAWQGRFPTALLPNPDLPPEKRLSWLFELDPFVHARMDPDWTKYTKEAWNSPGNLALAQRRRMPWYVYECLAARGGADPSGLGYPSYVGVTGLDPDAAALPAGHPRAGVFGADRRVSRSDVTDGVGSTVVVLETAVRVGPWTAGGRATARGVDPSLRPHFGRGREYGGLHPGATAALFADGSVRFLSDAADPATVEALVTVAAGDPVGWYSDD